MEPIFFGGGIEKRWYSLLIIVFCHNVIKGMLCIYKMIVIKINLSFHLIYVLINWTSQNFIKFPIKYATFKQ